MPDPRLSIILPTYDRALSLRHALAALLGKQTRTASFELIVVDNNSTDDTAALLARVDDPRLLVIREPRQGLSYARNTGLKLSHTEYVAFTDDDVEAAPDWAATIIEALDANPDVDGVGGRVLPVWPDGSPPRWLTHADWAPLALQDHGDARRVFDAEHPCGLVGANVAFRRRVFDRIGGFDASVQRVRDGVGSTEDHELLQRLYDAGGRMLYLPKLLVRARVQPERCDRAYHRRWHAGHGRFHARMHVPGDERSHLTLFGIPGHYWRAAAGSLRRYALASATGNRRAAFAAELRLRFFAGFARERLVHRHAGASQPVSPARAEAAR
jgi:glycosyltransferase involved in cell wall biosynthesis